MPTGLFVGRFQPFHKGHLATVKYALKEVDTLVIVVGSAQKSHEPRNPFTAGERITMIRAALLAEKIDMERVLTVPVPDVDVHLLWTRQVDMLVPKYDVVFANDPFTLMLFRERKVRTVEPPLQERSRLMATEVRRRMAEGGNWQELVPAPVARAVKEIGGVQRVKAVAQREHMRH
ncbi:nicotinamide-nucleotide adenylyltransferase [Candidatus Nitrososphaera sp. FF02]|uniref:nicotinamide-nucleotide adenylyltransferase n=1 Tax=Candidatus Nitrososphaera sp. FF02 TaxID=3398226 RepID=UPI0039EABA0F